MFNISNYLINNTCPSWSLQVSVVLRVSSIIGVVIIFTIIEETHNRTLLSIVST